MRWKEERWWKAPVNMKVISMEIRYQCSNEGLVFSEIRIKFRRELLNKLLSFANLSVKSDQLKWHILQEKFQVEKIFSLCVCLAKRL